MALVLFYKRHATAVETGIVGCAVLQAVLLHREWAVASDWGCPWLFCKAHVYGGCSSNQVSSLGGSETVLVRFVEFFWRRGSVALGLRQAWLERTGCSISKLDSER